jgi:hypothetical protein
MIEPIKEANLNMMKKYPTPILTPQIVKDNNELASKDFKRKWKIPQILNKIDAANIETKNRKSKKSIKIKKEFVEWSLLTKFDCYSKIFENEVAWVKVVWTLLFLIFSGFTAWLVILNIINYFHYEVTSIIEVKNERPTHFPAITICNSNPFTSSQAQSLMDDISLKTFNKTLDNMTYNEAYLTSSYLTERTKMYVNSPYYSDQNRIDLSAISSPPYRCSFNGEDCSGIKINEHFRRYFSYDYGNCYQFNTGYNFTNSPVNLQKQYTEGSDDGLQLMLGPYYNKNKYLSSFSDGLVVFVHNQSFAPSSSSAIRIETGKETNIALGRTFTTNQPYPYSECKDLSSFKSELYTLIKQSNYSYSQSNCFDLCFQRTIINTCGCYYTKYTRLYNSQPCLNGTQHDCLTNILNEINEEECVSDCPLECNSVTYQYSLSSLVYPSQSYYNKFFNDKSTLIFFNTTYDIDVSTKDLFKEYFLCLNVFYPYLQYTQITEIPKFTPIDLLSQIGGSLGMFLGFSLFHLIEIFEILLIFIFTWLKKDEN